MSGFPFVYWTEFLLVGLEPLGGNEDRLKPRIQEQPLLYGKH